MTNPTYYVLRGHEILLANGEWVYADTREPTAEKYTTRPCGKCGLPFTPEGHDGCLGTLPGVMNACCGHGCTESAYVQFWNGERLSGKAAINTMNAMKDSFLETIEIMSNGAYTSPEGLCAECGEVMPVQAISDEGYCQDCIALFDNEQAEYEREQKEERARSQVWDHGEY